jgi:hypothetical protein
LGSFQTQAVVACIVDGLAPYLGETMARSSARAQLEKLGIRGEAMNDAQAEALLARLTAGLKVFLPKEKCLLVVMRLRRALAEVRIP